MNICWTEPITEWCMVGASGEERIEVGKDFVVQHLLRRFEFHSFGYHLGDVLRELIEPSSRTFVGISASPVRCIVWPPGAPNFVRFADVVTRPLKDQRIGRLGTIPNSANENRGSASPPEMLSRH